MMEFKIKKVYIFVDNDLMTVIYYFLSPDKINNLGQPKYAVVAELADAHGSGPCGLTPVEVRLLSTASYLTTNKLVNLLF